MAAQYSFDRSHLVYELVVRQEPKQARMCGVGGKADRRPIDPPPIVQLRVTHPAGTSVPGSSKTRRDNSAESDSDSPDPRPFGDDVAESSTYSQSFLQNPYYFMFACLARPDDDAELHWLKDGRTRCTTGSVVSSLYHLKDPLNNNEDAGFFVFPDLSVRTEGSYRLKLSLFEVVGNNVHHCKSIYSAPFYVYTAKKFPGMEESTPLSCSLADQGIKIRIRKDIRVRKRQIPALTQPLSTDVDGFDSDGEDEDDPDRRPRRQTKRSRIDNGTDPGGSGVGGIQQQLPWPPAASINTALGPNIPPPPAAPPNSLPSSSSSGVVIPPPPKPGKEMPPNGIAMGVHVPPGSILPGPSVFDGRGGGIIQMDSPQQPGLSNQQKSPQTSNSNTQYRESNQVDGASSPQLSTSSQQSHPQYPAPPSPAAAAPALPQQQALQPQHQPSTTLANANGPPQSVAPPPSTHGPPPAMQHQPQHPQHMQHPQAGTYAPPPYSQWGPTAPMAAPAQPAVYDSYYHHQQHNHYATYAPPPQQPMPPPARYDYGTGMYTHSQAPPPPPAMPSYGYYDQHQHQHQQHHQPPHHPQQQMMPPHPHPYPQHQVHPPPPMHQYAPPPPAVGAPASNNAASAGGNPASMVTEAAQIGNGTNGTTPTHPPPNFASNSGVAAPSAQTPVTYDYGVVYNNRPPVESAAGRGAYGAPTPAPAPAQYGMTPMHSAPIPAPAPHPQSYPMHAAGAPPHSVTPMRHSPYGPPPHHHAPHPHPSYSYTPYSAPPPPAPEWGGQGFVANHQHGWDAYAHHPQHPQQQGHVPVGQPQPHTPVGASSSAMVTAGAVDQGHRIQLAPIPAENNNNGNSANNVSPSIQHRSSNPSPPSMRSNGRVTMSSSVGERMDDGYRHQGQVQGKKNPLSIGSIISNDAR